MNATNTAAVTEMVPTFTDSVIETPVAFLDSRPIGEWSSLEDILVAWTNEIKAQHRALKSDSDCTAGLAMAASTVPESVPTGTLAFVVVAISLFSKHCNMEMRLNAEMEAGRILTA